MNKFFQCNPKWKSKRKLKQCNRKQQLTLSLKLVYILTKSSLRKDLKLYHLDLKLDHWPQLQSTVCNMLVIRFIYHRYLSETI